MPVRLVVGAGRTGYEGWISTNIDSLNLLDCGDWASLVGEVRLDRVLAEHVWEHLSPGDGITALRNVADHLKPGGRVRIAVPDGRHPDEDYLAHVKPGGIGPGADDHKILYTVEILEAAMREARDKTLGMPRLILPSLQVNMRAGALPPPDASGKVFLKVPVNAL